MKICFTCKKEKEENEFHRDKNRKDGRYPNCKKCRNMKETPKYREKYLEERLEYARQYRKNNYEKLLLKEIKRRAKRKGLECDLKLEDIQIPDNCPVLGIPVFVESGKGRLPNIPSVDRIDNSKGYTRDNIVVVSWRANDLKRDATMEELTKIVRYYGGLK